MSGTITQAGIEAMGFRPMRPGQSLVAAFQSLHVYQARGFASPKDEIFQYDGTIGGSRYVIAIGYSVDEVAKTLIGDTLTENEEEWAKTHKCAPPYVLVRIGPTAEHVCTEGYIKQESEHTLTYDSFKDARAELRSIEDRVLGVLEPSLACAFRTGGNSTEFVRLDKTAFGTTPNGETVFDICVELRANAYLSVHVDAEWVSARMNDALTLSRGMNPKAARFIQAALYEMEPLKRFLYFFLAIEVETHSVFKTLDHEAELGVLLQAPPRLRASASRMLERQAKECRSLLDRFAWCAVAVWGHVEDADVAEVARLKKIRDQIAHGVLLAPPPDAVAAIEKLVAKLQRAHLM